MRNAAAQALIAVGGFQIIDDFLYFFFYFITTGNIGKGNFIGFFVHQAGAAFTERECAALATAAVLHAHEVEPCANQQQYRQQAENQAGKDTRFFFRDNVDADFIVQKRFDQIIV